MAKTKVLKSKPPRLPKPPVVWFDNNLMMDQAGNVRAVYLIDQHSYEHRSAEGQLEEFNRLLRAISALEKAPEVELLLVRRQTPVSSVIPLPNPAHPSLTDIAIHYRGRLIDELRQRLQEPTSSQWVLMVQLRRPGFGWTGLMGTAKRGLRELRRQGMEGTLGVPVLTDETYNGYVLQESQLYQLLRNHLRITRANTATCEWLLRKAMWRGLPGEPQIRQGWTSKMVPHMDAGYLAYWPDVREVLSLSDETITYGYNHVAVRQLVDGKWHTGYHRIYSLAAIPDEMNTDIAWAYRVVSSLPWPVEIVMRWRPVDFRETQRAITRRKQEIDNQANEAAETGRLEDDLSQAAEDAAAYEHQLKEDRAPSLLLNLFFVVAAPDQKALDERSSQLEELMHTMMLPIERPQGDMRLAYVSTIPGGPLTLKDYELRVTPELIAASAAGASGEVGDPEGAFIAWTLAGLPVYLHPSLGATINEALSGCSVGRLGGGKTFVWRLILILSILFYRARSLYIDPKGETDSMVERLPWLKSVTHKVALTPDSDCEGMLDLLAMARNGGSKEMAAQLALSVLSFMFNLRAGDEAQDDLAEAIGDALAQPVPSMQGVIDALHHRSAGNTEDSRARMARRLETWRTIGLGRALFGRPETEPISARSVLTILQLQHVPLPPEDRPRDDYSPQDVINSAIMQAAIGFANAFILQNRSEFCTVFIDEGWSIISNHYGSHMVRFLIRTGRANKKAVWIATQLAGDLTEERANLGIKFLFRGRDKAEIGKQLELAGLPVTDENTRTITDLRNGEALMVDIHGRAAIVKVDALFSDIVDAFDTRPPASD